MDRGQVNVSRIYLDNAATSFPKPPTVFAAVDDFNRRLGAAAGRGGYREAVEVDAILRRCRKRASELLGAESPERIVFTFNATDSLNLSLHGLLAPGDHVVTTQVEHNSVLRPLRELEARRDIHVSVVAADEQGFVAPEMIAEALKPTTRLVVVQHASNVTGAIQPIEAIGELAHNAGSLMLVDAAQSAGHLPLNVSNQPFDLVACAGHKGLLGPLGSGLLYVRPGLEDQLFGLRQGGTGSFSEEDRQPDHMPDKFEAGNLNAPALCGLDAGLAFLQEHGLTELQAQEQALTGQLIAGLKDLAGIRIVGPPADGDRLGVVSVTAAGFEAQVLTTVLDESFNIQSRAGLHCAPGAHAAAGTLEEGGTVRFSVGPFTTSEEIETTCDAVSSIVATCP